MTFNLNLSRIGDEVGAAYQAENSDVVTEVAAAANFIRESTSQGYARRTNLENISNLITTEDFYGGTAHLINDYFNSLTEAADDDLVINNSNLFINQNLRLLIDKKSADNLDIFPSVLSHEILTSNSDGRITTDKYFDIKTDYLENKQETIATRFFINSNNAELNRNLYYSNLEESFNDINFIYDSVNLSFEKIDNLAKENSIGNNIHNFFIGNTFNKIGKYYKQITTDTFFRFGMNSTSILPSVSFENNDTILSANEANRLKTIYTSVLRYKEDIELNRILNSDKIISQILLNTSLSLRNVYRDSWSFNFLENYSGNVNAYDNLSLKIFDQFPIIKLFPYLTSSELYNIDNNAADEAKNILCFNDIKTDDLRYDELFLSNKSFSSIFNDLNPISKMVASSNVNENIMPGSFSRINRESLENLLLCSNSFKSMTLQDRSRLTITNKNDVQADINFKRGHNYETTTGRKIAFNYNSKETGKANLTFPGIVGFTEKIASKTFNISSLNKVILTIEPSMQHQSLNRVLLLDTKGTEISDSNTKDYLNCPSFTVLNVNGLSVYGESGIEISGWLPASVLSDNSATKNKFEYAFGILGNFNFLNLFEYKRSKSRNIFLNQSDLVDGNKIVLKKDVLITSPRLERLTARFGEDGERSTFLGHEPVEDRSLGYILDRDTKKLFSSYIDNKQQAFVLLRNTNKLHKISEMKEKFINRNSELQSQDEYFNERVEIQQGSDAIKTQNHPLRNNIYSGIEKGKLSFKNSFRDIPFNVLDIQNEWPSYATRIKRIINNVKLTRIKLNDGGDLRIVNFLNSYKEKAKQLTSYNFENQLRQENKFSLVYGKEEHSFSSFEDSQFLLKSNEKFYSKNNFLLNSERVNSLDEYILENDEVSNLQFDMTSADYRSFISNYYPSTFFKSEKSYLNHLNVTTKIALSQENYWHLSFDKLLSDAIAEGDSLDVAKYLVYVALMQKNEFSVQNFVNLNEETNGSYNKYIGKVFDVENFKKQQSFTIRTLSEWCLRKISASKKKSEYVINVAAKNAERQDRNYFGELSTIGGEVYQFLFPFILHKFRISNRISPMNLYYTSFGSGEENVRTRGYFLSSGEKAFKNFITHKSFNYDAYLCEKESLEDTESSLNITEIDNKKVLFNVETEKSEVSYIVMKDNLTFESGQLNYDDDSGNLISESIVASDRYFLEMIGSYDNAESSLNYETSYTMELRDFYKEETQGTLSSTLKNSINEVLKYYNFLDFNDRSSIVDFVNNNDSIMEVIYSLIKPIAEHFSFFYDQVVNLSIKKNIDKITKFETDELQEFIPYGDNYVYSDGNIRGNSTFELYPELIWDSEALSAVTEDLSNLERLHANTANSTTSESEENSVNPLILNSITLISNALTPALETNPVSITNQINFFNKTKVRNDLEMCYNTFCNTNDLEALSHDILHYWLYSKENIQLQSISSSINSSFSEVENLLSDLGEGLNSSPSFLKYIHNDAKLNKISKHAIDKYIYQNFVYNKLNSGQGILNLENSFGREGVFAPNIELEKLNKELCKKSIHKVYRIEQDNEVLRKNLNLDIIRLGIKYDLAKEVLENKILHIKINIVNHKFPDVYFKPLNYYYMPCFTNILPFHYRFLKEQNNFSQIDPYNFVGYFDHNVKSLENRMSILDRETAELYIENIIAGTNFENALFEPGEGQIRENDTVSGLIYDQIATSNAIKYCDYVKQKVFNEKDLNLESISPKNILSPIVTGIYENMSDQEFKNVFLKEKSDFENIISLENGTIDLISNSDVIDSQLYTYDFLKMLDSNVSMTEFAKIFTDDIYYDVFNIRIERNELIKRIDESVYNSSGYGINYDAFRQKLFTKKELSAGYSFIIEANIL